MQVPHLISWLVVLLTMERARKQGKLATHSENATFFVVSHLLFIFLYYFAIKFVCCHGFCLLCFRPFIVVQILRSGSFVLGMAMLVLFWDRLFLSCAYGVAGSGGVHFPACRLKCPITEFFGLQAFGSGIHWE